MGELPSKERAMARRSAYRKPVVSRIPLTNARSNLGALVERVSTGNECFILEKDGLPVAALIDIDEFEDYLEVHDSEVNQVIAESREEYLAGKSRPAEELLRELEEEEAREREAEKTVR
ncbi:MAG: type II toxin-antitoxin system Phd/YefM family antitoxin [Ardenticatenaceae bacterium]